MGALNELERFLGTNEGKIAVWLVFFIIFALIFQSGAVCSIQLEKVASMCSMCKCNRSYEGVDQVINTTYMRWDNVSGTG